MYIFAFRIMIRTFCNVSKERTSSQLLVVETEAGIQQRSKTQQDGEICRISSKRRKICLEDEKYYCTYTRPLDNPNVVVHTKPTAVARIQLEGLKNYCRWRCWLSILGKAQKDATQTPNSAMKFFSYLWVFSNGSAKIYLLDKYFLMDGI